MLLLDRIERRVLCDRQSLMQAALSHGLDLDLPSVQDAWDDFDRQLHGQGHVPVGSDREDLLRALGLR